MAQELRTKGGAVMLWRLGPLKYGEQSRWSRAPEPNGMWAFPWPYYDSFFTYHQYKDRLPKTLKDYPNSSFPADKTWYEVVERYEYVRDIEPTDSLVWPEPDEYGRIGHPEAIDGKGNLIEVQVKEGRYDAQTAWIDTVGKRILPLRKFWYSGDLYSHIDRNGEIGNAGTFMGETEWYRMDAMDLVKAIRKCRGNRYIERGKEGGLHHWKSSVDHLEIFLPRGGGRVS